MPSLSPAVNPLHRLRSERAASMARHQHLVELDGEALTPTVAADSPAIDVVLVGSDSDAESSAPPLPPLPRLIAPALGARGSAERLQLRRRLLLDDDVLRGASIESRRYVGWRVALFWLLSILTAGTLAIIAHWPGCRRRRAEALSAPCSDAEADVCLVSAGGGVDDGGGGDGSLELCPVEEVAEQPLEQLSLRAAWARVAARPPAVVARSRRMIVFRHTRYLLRLPRSRGQEEADAAALSSISATAAPPPYSPRAARFEQLESDEAVAPPSLAAGLSAAEAASRLLLFGRNLIEVPVPPWQVLLLRECIHPFVIFQVWAVIVWVTEAYYSFSCFILAAAIATAVLNYRDVRTNLADIRRISLFTTPVTVVRGSTEAVVDSSQLVPGDVVRLTDASMRLPCDLVLCRGQCTVTEALLTGEAVVVVKQPLVGVPLAAVLGTAADARNTLYGGTQVVELRAPRRQRVLAVVVRTGFESVKGRLVLSILHPRAPAFKFMQEGLKFLGILFACAVIGFAINAKALHDVGFPLAKIIQRGCDMVTIVVPPALPLALSVGVMYALVALRRRQIFCISPSRINLCGKVNCFVFDKTGTLTTDSLALAELRPVVALAGSTPQSAFAAPSMSPYELPRDFLGLLAACHSLTHVKGRVAGDPLELETFAFTGALMVEPMGRTDHAGMEEGGGEWGENGGDGDEDAAGDLAPPFISRISVFMEGARLASSRLAVNAGKCAALDGASLSADACSRDALASPHLFACEVLRQHDFSPQLQRMGVVVRRADGGLTSFVKGSPEAVLELCSSGSGCPASVPSNFGAVLRTYTRRGLRVLGCAVRNYAAGTASATAADALLAPARLPSSGASAVPSATAAAEAAADARHEAEKGLRFLGFIVLENKCKPQSAPTIARLRSECGEEGMLLHMATGDNAVSAVAVARECGLLPPGRRVFLCEGAGADASVDAPFAWHDVDDDAAEGLDPATLLPLESEPVPAVAHSPYALAMTGRAFEALQKSVANGRCEPGLLDRALVNCSVFARMSPEHKGSLVEHLQRLGLYVGMVGDGANDSLALRAAHVGVSLSQVEASVAAPFTYAVADPSIDALPPLLCEGRCALTTSFCLFQFMALYSTIQFSNALLIVFAGSFLSNNMYLFQDLFVVLILSLTIGNTAAAARLSCKRPSGRLFSATNLLTTFGFIALTFAGQGCAFALVRAEPWYGDAEHPLKMAEADDPEGTNSATPETTAVFLMASLQYVACAMIFAVGTPFKLSPTTNRPFMVWLTVCALASLGLFLLPTDALYAALSLQRFPSGFNVVLLALSVASFLSYFALMLGLRWCKEHTAFVADLERRFFRGPAKPHRALRNAWSLQFAKANVSAMR